MDWINVNEQSPAPYQEVIICSNERRVKAATYLGDGKYNTFLQVVYWQPMPMPPEILNEVNDAPVEPVKKKRGRPKKNG